MGCIASQDEKINVMSVDSTHFNQKQRIGAGAFSVVHRAVRRATIITAEGECLGLLSVEC